MMPQQRGLITFSLNLVGPTLNYLLCKVAVICLLTPVRTYGQKRALSILFVVFVVRLRVAHCGMRKQQVGAGPAFLVCRQNAWQLCHISASLALLGEHFVCARFHTAARSFSRCCSRMANRDSRLATTHVPGSHRQPVAPVCLSLCFVQRRALSLHWIQAHHRRRQFRLSSILVN